MEAKLLCLTSCGLSAAAVARQKLQRKQMKVRSSSQHPSIVSMEKEKKKIIDQVEYKDNFFHQVAINHLTFSLRSILSGDKKIEKLEKKGYDGLMEAASCISTNYNPTHQQQLIFHVLTRAFSPQFLSLARILLPQSKLTRELFAIFTALFFSWLVGPCEVRETETNGTRENNAVYIEKCRFLDGIKCAGMCVNLCKMPSQKFIKEMLGMPINMIPNFEDLSCELIFGQNPPAADDDPALKRQCHNAPCKAMQESGPKLK